LAKKTQINKTIKTNKHHALPIGGAFL